MWLMIGRCTIQVQTFHAFEKFGTVGGPKLTDLITIYELKHEIGNGKMLLMIDMKIL